MALMQTKLKSIKSKSPKVVVEKYQDAFDSVVAETKDVQQLRLEVESYLTAGKFVNAMMFSSCQVVPWPSVVVLFLQWWTKAWEWCKPKHCWEVLQRK